MIFHVFVLVNSFKIQALAFINNYKSLAMGVESPFIALVSIFLHEHEVHDSSVGAVP